MLTREELTRWTSALRANPEQQISGKLTSDGETGFCCLGKLCQVVGLKAGLLTGTPNIHVYEGSYGTLPSTLAEKFGSSNGLFSDLGMPNLGEYKGAAQANDQGATWLEIADHFDKYYPCTDESLTPEKLSV